MSLNNLYDDFMREGTLHRFHKQELVYRAMSFVYKWHNEQQSAELTSLREENETLRQRNLSDPLLQATFKHLTKRVEELEGAIVWPPKDVLVERCAAAVHLAYCKNYEQRKGEPYWTGGDYNKLDDETKEIDRTTVRAVLRDALRKDEHG